MPSSKVAPKRRIRANRMPLGRLTPTIAQDKANAKALELRNAMADCILSDAAIQLIALRVNTGASVAKLARGLGIERTAAYVMLARPQAQQLMTDLARTLMGDAAIMGAHTMMRIMGSKDPALAYRAAETMMERAGLGISQRTQPEGATKTVFAFAFGAPQTALSGPPDGTRGSLPDPEGPSKTKALGSGEAPAPVILQPTAPLRSVTARGRKSSAALKSA
jgi:hypothetical protein